LLRRLRRDRPNLHRRDGELTCVAAQSRAGNRRAMPSKPKLRPATIRFEPELWARIERLAQADRSPVASYLALVIADAIAAQSAGTDSRVAA
jgi:hypothetical protein